MDTSGTTALPGRLRERLPAEVFERQPRRALLVLPAVAGIVTLTLGLVEGGWPWWAQLPAVLGLANLYAFAGFLAHEVLHGAVVRRRWLQDALGTIGFGPFLVSPTLWRVWHNQVHHGNTNAGDRDPDSFGTMRRFERAPSTRFVTKLAPGSGTPVSYLFLFYWFTFHGQVVLWIQSRYLRGFERLDRRRAVAETAAFAGAWLLFALWAGPRGALLAGAVPMLIANAIVMSYIATNHFMRPQTERNDPVGNSMSVTTLPVIDGLHLNFSHHVEHHLFPAMSARFAPRVRTELRSLVGDAYVSPPHPRAVAALYRTPRVYLDAGTLVDPYTDRRVAIPDLTAILTAAD